MVTILDDLSESDLGYADLVEERKIEEDKWVFIEGCKNPRAVTILIRGGTERIVDEAERSREEDPYTDYWVKVIPSWLVPTRSRFLP